MRQNRLLVLAAGILQIPVIQKAKEMGCFVIAADGDANAPGLKLADKAICSNITSKDDMLDIAVKERVDGLIHPCSEVSMDVMGYINDRLKLSGISEQQAYVATNKHLMRKAFLTNESPSPKSSCFDNPNDAWKSYMTQYEGDVILKPSRNSGSRGIHKIERSSNISMDKFIELFTESKIESRDNSVMLEQFIEGPEFSVEIIVWDGIVNVLAVTDKKTTGAPHFVELGHNQPSCFSMDTVKKIKEAAISGVKALGVKNCACHAEIKMEQASGKAYIMEIGARLGGDFISTILTRLSSGIDMVEAAINCALGIKPDLSVKGEKHGVCIRYFCPPVGKLLKVLNTDILNSDNVYAKEIYVRPGSMISEITSSSCRSGHVIVTAKSPQDAILLADKLVSDVKFIVEE